MNKRIEFKLIVNEWVKIKRIEISELGFDSFIKRIFNLIRLEKLINESKRI